MIEECLVVELRITGDDCPLAAASRATGTTIDARPPQRRADGTVLLQFSTRGERAVTAALDADDRIRYLHVSRAGDRANYRCLSTAACVAGRLTDAGLLIESLRYRAGAEHHVGAVVGYDVLRTVLEAVGEWNAATAERGGTGGENDGADATSDATAADEAATHTGRPVSGTEGSSRRSVGITVQRVYPLGGEDDAVVAQRWDLTPAQEEALRTAYEMGYFAVPRASTASEVAAALGVSKSAFLERFRRGQAALFAGLFD